VKEVRLTLGLVALVSEEDFEMVSYYKWHANPCHLGADGKNRSPKYYARSMVMGYMHRFILDAPREKVVDHIDGNSLNNQRYNLRLVTREENIALSNKRRSEEPFL